MDLQVAVELPDTSLSDRKASDALARANALVIASNEDYSQADQFCRGLFSLRKEIEADFAESEDAARKAKKATTDALAVLIAQKEGHVLPVFHAEKIIKGKLLSWSEAEEKKRQELEAKAREEARRNAESEQLRKAALLEAQGKTAQAEAVLQRPTKVAAVVLPPSTPERESIISRRYSCKIMDADAVPREYCLPDTVRLNRLAVADKEKFNVPGCELKITIC